MEIGTVLAVVNVVSLLCIAGLAYMDGMLLPSQMVKRYPLGFPLVANGSFWANLVIMTMILYRIGSHLSWTGKQGLISILLGIPVSFLLHRMYLKGKFPDALAGAGRISPAGIVHALYTGVVIVPALVVFYVFNRTSNEYAIDMGVLLSLWVLIANHLPLHFMRKTAQWPWCPEIFKEERRPLLLQTAGIFLIIAVTVFRLH